MGRGSGGTEVGVAWRCVASWRGSDADELRFRFCSSTCLIPGKPLEAVGKESISGQGKEEIEIGFTLAWRGSLIN